MPSHAATTEFFEQPSNLPFDQTLDRVTSAIESAGIRIFAIIDHAAGAREVGLSMPPATLVIYGHPKGGTPLMQASPAAALDLPLHVLVRGDADGHVYVSFHPIVALLMRAGVPEALASRLAPAQSLLIDAIRA